MSLKQIRPGAAFEATFDSAVRQMLVDGLARAYDTAVELHDEARGSNERTFGFGVYEYAVHELAEGATDSKGRVEVASTYPSFRLNIGEFQLACHRVGKSEFEDIWGCFPNAESAAHTMVEEQLWLPGMVKHLGVENARKLVLAHMGNNEEGLRAVYLCSPWRTEGTRITAWVYCERLWTARQDAQLETKTQERVPDEVIDEVVVRRRAKKVHAHEEG
ncbi:MAG: hypothetical protein R3B13_31440 [Polyangiaceae bacterium]